MSYNSENQVYDDQAQQKKKLAVYKSFLSKVFSSGKPEPAIVTLLSQQIESLKSSLLNYVQPDINKAQIIFTVAEEGYDNCYAPKPKTKLYIFLGILVCIVFFALGWLTNRFILKKKLMVKQKP